MTIAEQAPTFNFRDLAAEHMGEGGLLVYESEICATAAQRLKQLELPYGLNVRYAFKANPHPEIAALFDQLGLHFDASSVYEAQALLNYGVDGEKISLSSQVLRNTPELKDVLRRGVLPVATSLRQLKMLGGLGCREPAVRVNSGMGSGHYNRTNVGGPASSFGIWHEQLDEVINTATSGGQTITRLHTHTGSGADSSVWRRVIRSSLAVAYHLPDVTTLDIGGGFKVARMPGEEETNMEAVAEVFTEELQRFDFETGRELKLEIEPGTFLVANAGTLLGRVEEIAETSQYKFLKLNVGMNALLRPSHYGAQHPMEVLTDTVETEEYVVVGPACESGDILTPAPGDPEGILPRELKKAEVGDFLAIGGAGAYGPTMASVRYNHVPEATEIVV